MTRIVSVTSIPLKRDSRTLRVASSIARLGYESVVVEAEPSDLECDGLPFQLISARPEIPTPDAAAGAGRSAPVEAAAKSPPAKAPAASRLVSALPEPLAGPLRALAASVNGVRGFTALLRLYVRDYLRGNRETEAVLPPADIYYLRSYPQVLAVARMCRRTGAKLLYDSPDAYWEPEPWHDKAPASRVALKLYELAERFAARRAVWFTSASEGQAELIEKRFKRRPLVLHNYHDPRNDTDAERDVREVTGVGDDDFLLVTVGNAKPGMTVDEAIAALELLPDRVHLAFVGRGFEPWASRAEDPALGGRLHLVSHVPPTEIVSFIRRADAFPIFYRPLSANDRVAVPNKIFHAIAAGLPVLYPPIGPIKTIGDEHELGLEMDTADPESIATAVLPLSEDPGLASRYAENARRAAQSLSWEREEETLAKMIASTLKGTPVRAPAS